MYDIGYCCLFMWHESYIGEYKMCKKMRKYVFVCLLLCAFLSGCSKGNVTSDEGIVNIPENINEGNSSTEIMGGLEHGSGNYLTDDNTGEAKVKKMFLNDFSGYICYAGNEKLICLSDKVTLLNSQNLDVLNEIQSEDLEISFYDFQDCEVYANENGYIVIGTVYNAENASTRLVMVEFNQELSNVKVINVEEWVGAEREIMAYKLIDDGRKILYSTMSGFYLYDSVCGETTVLDTRDVFVLDFAFIESSNQILFTGNDLNSERVLGRLALGEKASAAEIYEGNPWGKIWAYGEGALIEEADVYGEEKAGRVFCYNVQDGIRQYPLTSREESGSILLSCEGEYYATNTFVQNEGYVLRIYSSEDGQLVCEYLMTYEKYGEKFRLNNILICENTNKIILVVKGLQDQEGTWLIAIDL